MFESIDKLFRMIVPWILDSSLHALAVQYIFIAAASLFHIYQILRMRRDTVVVLSHGRIWFGALFGASLGLGYYRAAMWLYPQGVAWWLFALYLFGVIISLAIFRGLITFILAPFIGGRRSIIDTVMREEKFFNCNWPLIPRCITMGLTYLVFFGLIFVKFVE